MVESMIDIDGRKRRPRPTEQCSGILHHDGGRRCEARTTDPMYAGTTSFWWCGDCEARIAQAVRDFDASYE